ncbi:hypothetical protein E4U39_000686 [Claviceps sp. Clav50 group G5]|nr:hypothetical protein E4U39_000686 [Claviceps sp. Clav50 group G5]
MERLEDTLRVAYRESFHQALQDGSAKPFLFPYSMLGTMILPALWLTIPHVSRPWIYRTRWAVLAFVAVFNVHVMRVCSSTNFGCAYTCGLFAAWGIMQTLGMLVWKRPQFEAARVVKVVKKKKKKEEEEAKSEAETETEAEADLEAEGVNGGQIHKGTTNGIGHNGLTGQQGLRLRNGVANGSLEKVARPESMSEVVEYRWQKFPAEAPFLDRLGWVLDLMTSLRGAGWSYSINSIPRPIIPPIIHDNAKVDISSISLRTTSGFTHPATEREFLLGHLSTCLLLSIFLDFMVSQMKRTDPYFLLGPDHTYDVPPFIANKSPPQLRFCRLSWVLVVIVAAIVNLFTIYNVSHYYICKMIFPSRAFLWNYPSAFGGFCEVLDRGLAGWWGSWWHQTFRLQFLAPSTYLLERGYLRKGSAAANLFGLFVTFLQSGLLHAAGSLSTIPRTKPLNQLWFFLLQALGIVVQQYLAAGLRRWGPGLPRVVRRGGNIAFSIGWLYFTAPMFVDDVAASGLWLYEPVPVSVLRLLGLGRVLGDGNVTEAWWRWDKEYCLKIYEPKHWWEAGIAI